MNKKRFVTLQEAMAIIEADSDDDDDDAKDVQASKTMNVIYIPSLIGRASDSEMIDDEEIKPNASLRMEIAGTVEVEFEKQKEKGNEEPSTKKSKPNEDQMNVQDVQTEPSPKYKSLSDFSKPKWTKLPALFKAEPKNEEATAIRQFQCYHAE